MGQMKSMLKNAICGSREHAKGSTPIHTDGEDSDTESQHGQYRPLRNLRDTGDIPFQNMHDIRIIADQIDPGAEVSEGEDEENHNHLPNNHHHFRHHRHYFAGPRVR